MQRRRIEAYRGHQETIQTLLESYCSRLGNLVEHRYSSLALLEAKQQAEKAAIAAHEAMLKAKEPTAPRANSLPIWRTSFALPSTRLLAFRRSSSSAKAAGERHPEYAGYIHDAG
ncbi:MAG TPA: hypothetical protein VE687_00710 [Stellaceae bacterium]|nr:hypothetical protein [Stellaceae bacterium]